MLPASCAAWRAREMERIGALAAAHATHEARGATGAPRSLLRRVLPLAAEEKACDSGELLA